MPETSANAIKSLGKGASVCILHIPVACWQGQLNSWAEGQSFTTHCWARTAFPSLQSIESLKKQRGSEHSLCQVWQETQRLGLPIGPQELQGDGAGSPQRGCWCPCRGRITVITVGRKGSSRAPGTMDCLPGVLANFVYFNFSSLGPLSVLR